MMPRRQNEKKEATLDMSSEGESGGEEDNGSDAGKTDATLLTHGRVAPVFHAAEVIKDEHTPNSVAYREEYPVNEGKNYSYLPAHILESATAVSQNAPFVDLIPREQMTSREKKRQRNSIRRAKKRKYDMICRATENNGVLEAGSATRLKRGILPSLDKAISRRFVMKQKAPQVSSRQQVLEQRKQLVSTMAPRRAKNKASRPRSNPIFP